MKLLSLFVACCLAAVGAATPFDGDGADRPSVNIYGCVEKCLRKKYRKAGCGHQKDWDCLCRYGNISRPLTSPFPRFPRRTEELTVMSRKGKIAYEVNRCFRSKCTSAEEVCVLFPAGLSISLVGTKTLTLCDF